MVNKKIIFAVKGFINAILSNLMFMRHNYYVLKLKAAQSELKSD